MVPKNIKLLEILEKKYRVVDTFKYKTSTAWINVKNYIYAKSVNVEFFAENKKWNKKKAFYFFILSLKNLFKRTKGVLFVGAGSGILEYDGKIVDVYKTAVKEKEIIYFTSIDELERIYKIKQYYKKHHVIVHSLLFSALRNIIAKSIKSKVTIDTKEIIVFLKERDIAVKENDFKYIYAKFIAGYWIYKILFKFLKIKKAYVVSAYSNTELIAVLKEKNIPVIEIQHGIVGEMHRGYNYKIHSKLLPIPDKILVYDNFWKQELISAGYYKHNQIDLFERFQYKIVEDIKIFDKPFIVFTGQGIFRNEIEKFLKESVNFLEKNDIYLAYLPHPSEKVDNFNIKSEYVKILNKKEYLTEQYIKSSMAHISIYSSCHFDAIHFHGKTFVFDVMNDNIMTYYKEKYPQNVFFIKQIEDIKL